MDLRQVRLDLRPESAVGPLHLLVYMGSRDVPRTILRRSPGGVPSLANRADAPTPEPRHGDVVAIDGRSAVFLYRRGLAAVVRFDETVDSRVVLFSKLQRAS
jgi:hypothetical protein